MTVTLITGANRGIGLEHTRQALEAGETVIAACRTPDKATQLYELAQKYPDRLEIAELDVAKCDSVAALKKTLGDRPIDILVNNAGTMGADAREEARDGQALGSIDYNMWADMMNVNLLGAMRVSEALIPNVLASEGKTIVMISSALGSIAQNTSGGTYLYRSSKAALNMIARGLAQDLEDKHAIVIGLSPGWTQTDMGGANARWTVEESVSGQREVISGLTTDSSGKFYDLQGSELPW